MRDNDIKFGKTLIILIIFTGIILIFQFSRMGILTNSSPNQREKKIDSGEVHLLNLPTIESDIPVIGIISDDKDTNKKFLIEGSIQYLEHLGYQYKYVDTSELSELKQYDMLLVFLTDFDEGKYMASIMEYVQSGKYAYFPYLPFENNIYSSNLRKIGVIESNYENFKIDQITDKGGIIGDKDKVYTVPRNIEMTLKVRLTKEAEILLETIETPVFWTMEYGEGSFLVSSTEFLASSESRGILAYALYCGLYRTNNKAMIQPFYNVSTTVLQDIALPVQVQNSPLLLQLNINQESFMLDYYFKLFKNISQKNGDKISMSYTIDYSEFFNDKLPETLQRSQFRLYSSQILNMGGEIISGGYSNHALGLEGELQEIGFFIPWESEQIIKESIAVSERYLKDIYPNYTLTSYVAPHGRIGFETLSRIGNWFPSVETILNRYVIEYPDQLLGDFTAINSGNQYLYAITTENGAAHWGTINAIQSLGVNSLGFHSYNLVKDTLDFKAFSSDIQYAYEFQELYGLNKKTPYEAGEMIKQYQNMKIYYKEDGQGLQYEIDAFVEGTAFFLRSEKFPTSEDAKIISVGKDYIIYPKSPKGFIEWEETE